MLTSVKRTEVAFRESQLYNGLKPNSLNRYGNRPDMETIPKRDIAAVVKFQHLMSHDESDKRAVTKQ